MKTERKREQIEFVTKFFFYYYSNLGEIKDDGSANLLLDLMQRYSIESQTVHLVMSTMNNEKGRHEIVQRLINSGKIVATHKKVHGVWTPDGWEVLESRSTRGSYFHHHPEHGDWSTADEADAISKCRSTDRWRIKCIDEGRNKGRITGP